MDRTWRSKSGTSKKLFQTITKNSITRESFQNSPITAATTSVASNVRSLKTANDFVTAFKTLNANFANMALQDQESLHEQVKSAVLSLRNQIRIQKESFVIDAKLASVFDEVVRLYGKMAVSQKGTVSLHTRKNSIQESNEDISHYQRSETVTPNKRASVGSLSSLSRSGSTSNDKTFLKNIYSTFKKSQKNPSSAVDLRKKSMETSPTQLGVNQKSLYINMLRYFADLTYQLMKIEGLGVEIIIQTNNYLNMVLICLDLDGKMFVNAIFSILITLIGYAGGHKLVYNAFISLQNQRNETTSFKSLEYHLRLSIMRSDLEVIPKVVKFCNIFVNGSQNLEQKIYLQYISKQNGITENIRSLLSREETAIRRAARSYVNNIIDVEKFQTIMFENANLKEKLAKAASRATHAEKDKTEIDRGQLKKISDLERENIKIKIFLSSLSESMSHIQAGSGDGSISQEEILKLIEKLKNANFGPLDQAMAYKTNLSAADQKPEAKKEEITISEDLMDKSIGEQTTKPKKVKKTIKVKKRPDIPKNLLDLKVIHLPGRMPVLNVSTYDVAKVIGSIFEKLKISAVIKILESKIIEQIFLLTNVSKKTPQTDQLLAKKSNNYVSPLEDKRQRNIFICMRPFNGDISRILALADSLDTDSELPDVIQSMKNSLPTQAEIDFVVSSVESCLKQNPEMDISQLPAVDQFVYNLAPYKDIIHHFEILIEMIDFEEECDILSQYLDAIFMSSRSLSSSELVNILLSIILALVNYFNSQKRGIVYGFSIEYLPQIDQIKSKTYEQITLMHLIAYFMLQNFEYLVGSRIDFTYLAMASTLKMDEIIARTRIVGNRVKKIRDEMERRLLGLAGKNSYSYSVKPEFESKVKKFENLYSELNENLTLTQVAYLEVAKLFNIQKLDQSTVIFESWKAFFKNFSDALADLETPKISQIFYGKQKTAAKETEQNGIIEEELSASDNNLDFEEENVIVSDSHDQQNQNNMTDGSENAIHSDLIKQIEELSIEDL